MLAPSGALHLVESETRGWYDGLRSCVCRCHKVELNKLYKRGPVIVLQPWLSVLQP